MIPLQQCLPAVAENYDVAVHNMSAVLLEKQQQLLAYADLGPLELLAPLP
jgi:hypothetical protein